MRKIEKDSYVITIYEDEDTDGDQRKKNDGLASSMIETRKILERAMKDSGTP